MMTPADPPPARPWYRPKPLTWFVFLAAMAGGAAFSLHQQALQRAANAAALARVVEAGRQAIADRDKSFAQGHSVTGTTARIERLQSALAQAGGGLSGMNRQMIEVTQDLVGWMKGPAQDYETAYRQFASAGGIKPAGLTSTAALAERRRLLAECIAANDRLAEAVRGSEGRLRGELARRGVPGGNIDAIANGYVESAHVGLQLRLRETDRALFQNLDALLANLGQNWGHWHVGPEGKLVFDQHDGAVRHNDLFRTVNAAAADEKVEQQQIIDANTADQAKLSAP